MAKQKKITPQELKRIENVVMKSVRSGDDITKSFEKASAVLPKFNTASVQGYWYSAIRHSCKEKYARALEEGKKARLIEKGKATAEQVAPAEAVQVQAEVAITKEKVLEYREQRASRILAAAAALFAEAQELQAENERLFALVHAPKAE